jgi:hypothetical protein
MSLLDSVQESERTLSEAHARLARIESEMVDVETTPSLRYFDISDLPDMNDDPNDDYAWEEEDDNEVMYAHVVRGGGYRDEIVQIGGDSNASSARIYRENQIDEEMARRARHENLTRRMMEDALTRRRQDRSTTQRPIQYINHGNPGLADLLRDEDYPSHSSPVVQRNYYPGREYIQPPSFQGNMRPDRSESAARTTQVASRRAIQVRQGPDFSRVRHHPRQHTTGAIHHNIFAQDGHEHDADLLQMIMSPPRSYADVGDAEERDEHSIMLLNMVCCFI